MSADIIEIKKLLKTNKLVIGTEKTLKLIRTKALERIYLAKNCPDDAKDSILRYAKLAGIETILLDTYNDELGDICKKPFFISVVGVAKE